VDRTQDRVLAIGLDAFEIGLVAPMIAEGRLPNIERLTNCSARFRLDHKRGKFTGLAWEHFSTGRSPDNQRRWSAVSLDAQRYAVGQPPSNARPFVADLPCRAAIFDVPYFDLRAAANVSGVTSWGAHDPGTEEFSRPEELRTELTARFGEYPAPEWIYGFSWPSPARTEAAGKALREAVRTRCKATRWLFGERIPDWRFAAVVVSESHSAIEQFWHGVDPTHPLAAIPSARPAREALVGVYEEIDALIGNLAEAFPDATLVLFSMHGMGANKSDLAAMFLVPELLYRHAFGRPYARLPGWPTLPAGTPVLGEDEDWETVMRKVVPWPAVAGTGLARIRRLLGDRRPMPGRAEAGNLGWMPAARYAAFWPSMPAFALPAYYDTWIRLNLAGRERDGRIAPGDYSATREALVDLIAACRDPVSGREVIETVVLADKPADEIGATEADIYLSFAGGTTGLRHPTLGTIGPVPYRRTGGHTGDWGFLYVAGAGVSAGDRGAAEAFDVVPTIIDLLGAPRRPELSGTSLMPRLA
jgi:predicted AlkP superfamily phosphohydrolase/phosphomutase